MKQKTKRGSHNRHETIIALLIGIDQNTDRKKKKEKRSKEKKEKHFSCDLMAWNIMDSITDHVVGSSSML